MFPHSDVGAGQPHVGLCPRFLVVVVVVVPAVVVIVVVVVVVFVVVDCESSRGSRAS